MTRLITWNSTAIRTACSSAPVGTPAFATAAASWAPTEAGSTASLSRNTSAAWASARIDPSCGASTAAATSAPP